MRRIAFALALVFALVALPSCVDQKVPSWLIGEWETYDEDYRTKNDNVTFTISENSLLKKDTSSSDRSVITLDYMQQYVSKWILSVTTNNAEEFVISGTMLENGREQDKEFKFTKTGSNKVKFTDLLADGSRKSMYLQKKAQ